MSDSKVRPFPALTPAQRYHFDLFGYVIVENLLTGDECSRILGDLQRLKADLEAIDDPDRREIDHAFFHVDQPHHKYIAAISQSIQYPGLLEYITHPRVVGISEEVLGGRCHILECNAHINHKAPDWPMRDDGQPVFGFHRGWGVADGGYMKNGLHHSHFVKVLTNLTDLGPDDGGTVVIAGSHRMDVDEATIIDIAYDDPSLIHRVEAPAGSALLFTECLMHATGRITSDNERAVIIAGYATSHFPWKIQESFRPGFRVEPEFLERVPDDVKHLYQSEGYIQRETRYRTLRDPVDTATYPKPKWPGATVTS